MNCLRNSRRLLPRFLGRDPVTAVGARPPQLPTTRYHDHAASPRREVLGSIKGSFIRQVIKPAIHRQPGPWNPRHYCTSPPPSTAPRFVFRWYHDPRKVAAAVSVLSGAALLAFCHRCLEVVPCTNRIHFVLLSPQSERERGESEFRKYKEKVASRILGPLHPDSVRVRRIAEKIIHAAHRGLGIDDAVILRVTESHQNGKAWRPQPQTKHLDGLDWEVIVVDDKHGASALNIRAGKVVVFTGFLEDFSTDGEIATLIAHEVGHIIARHESDMTWAKWVPMPLWVYFRKRMETEADHIGLLLLAAAGFNPHIALAFCKKKAKMIGVQTFFEYHLTGYPPWDKRFQYLAQVKIMEMALELYREVTSMNIVTEQYFR